MHFSAVSTFQGITNLNPPSWAIAGMYIVKSLQVEMKWSYAVIVVFIFCHKELKYIYNILEGQAVTQLLEALRYKLEGRGFDFRWCHWNFSLT